MKKLKLFLSQTVLLFLTVNSLWCRSVNFPVRGFQTTTKSPVIIKAEWNENWFTQKKSHLYNHELARVAALLAEVSYVDPVKYPDINELSLIYRNLGFKKPLIEYHYSQDYSNSMWGNDQTAFSFATKQIETSEGMRNLVIILIRGTPLNANEWISNLNISDRTENAAEFHEGFLRATKQIESSLISYLLKNKIDIEGCCLFITGHSRGAAVANLLSAELCETDLFEKGNIYTYTFACPNVTLNNNVHDQKYDFIWNIVNAEDLVTYVPVNHGNWHYKKYGNIKTLVNSWNTPSELYNGEYIPRMNGFFTEFLGRKYTPFEMGPFLPVQIVQAFTSINSNVHSYYNGITSIRSKAELAFNKIFPEEQIIPSYQEEVPENGGNGIIYKKAVSWIKKYFDIEVNQIIDSFVDMHAMETYLSWLMSMSQSEAFSETPSSIITLSGSGDYAVFDSQGNTLASVQDGKVDLFKIKKPVAANSLLQGSVAIGLPSEETFSLAITRESILPSFLSIKIQHFSACGEFLGETKETKLYPHFFKLYKIDADGKILNDGLPPLKVITGFEPFKIRKAGNIKSQSKFALTTEVSGNSTGTFNAGLHWGTKNLYGSFLAGHNAPKIGRSLELSSGLGNQVILTQRILLDTEIYTNFFWAFSDKLDKEDNPFNLVPSVRFSLSYIPLHKLQFFAGVNIDFHIKDFNDAAFDKDFRVQSAGNIDIEKKLYLVPNISIGIKF